VKANHVPRTERLRVRILKLEYRLDECWTREPDRFYQFCRHCGQTVITVNTTGHGKGCMLRGTPKEISYYKRLLAECVT